MGDIYNKKKKMVKFGILKSKIEKVLIESYKTGTFKKEFTTFKKLVLENKNLSNVFYMYDELTSNKGLTESHSREFISECISLFNEYEKKITPNQISDLNTWVKGISCDNHYENIDNVFSKDVITIESRIKSKNIISENLKKLPINKEKPIEIPLSSIVNIANKTIKNYIDTLSESDKSEVIRLLSEDDTSLSEKYNEIKSNVIKKLSEMKESSSEDSILNRIDETISKISSEKYNKLNYFKLKDLNQNLLITD